MLARKMSVPTLVVALFLGTGSALAFEIQARQAILIDLATDTVLLEKNVDERMAPASLTKIVTAYMAFEALESGRIGLEDAVRVSEKAWRMGGSQMFIEVGTNVRFEDLLRGLIIQSGNDAAVAIAEALAGTTEAFAARTNARMLELGLDGTHFVNPHGLDAPDHYTTARDLAAVAVRLIESYPDRYHYFAETEFTYNGISQRNRNPLLTRGISADGLKTGYTSGAGYGLVASAERDGRRLVLVINGAPSAKVRAQEAEALLLHGFHDYETVKLASAADPVATVPVSVGTLDSVPVSAAEDLVRTLASADTPDIRIETVLPPSVEAPVAAGQRLGHLAVTIPGEPGFEVPLVAAATVERLGWWGQARRWIAGWL